MAVGAEQKVLSGKQQDTSTPTQTASISHTEMCVPVLVFMATCVSVCWRRKDGKRAGESDFSPATSVMQAWALPASLWPSCSVSAPLHHPFQTQSLIIFECVLKTVQEEETEIEKLILKVRNTGLSHVSLMPCSDQRNLHTSHWSLRSFCCQQVSYSFAPTVLLDFTFWEFLNISWKKLGDHFV